MDSATHASRTWWGKRLRLIPENNFTKIQEKD
jgi:hypothetical protein